MPLRSIQEIVYQLHLIRGSHKLAFVISFAQDSHDASECVWRGKHLAIE